MYRPYEKLGRSMFMQRIGANAPVSSLAHDAVKSASGAAGRGVGHRIADFGWRGDMRGGDLGSGRWDKRALLGGGRRAARRRERSGRWDCPLLERPSRIARRAFGEPPARIQAIVVDGGPVLGHAKNPPGRTVILRRLAPPHGRFARLFDGNTSPTIGVNSGLRDLVWR
jgi:hypothetical protein